MKTFKQMIVVEFRNCAPYIELLHSKKKITLERVVTYLEKNDGFDPDEDSVTYVDESSDIDLDNMESTE